MKTVRVEFDASPWGGGAVLYQDGVPTEFLEVSWSRDLVKKLSLKIGASSGQTCWEYMTLYLVLLTWARRFRERGFAILGDNTSALSTSLSYKGKAGMGRISREIAWRKVRYAWRFAVGHLPCEANTVADALSRTSAPDGADKKSFPTSLSDALRREAPWPADCWTCA